MRDTSRDGELNRFVDYVVSHFKLLWLIVMAIPPLRKWVNNFLIDRAVKFGQTRPHPFSSMPIRGDSKNAIAPYTSFESLMDRNWFCRYLPVKEMSNLPDLDKVAELFKLGGNKPKLSECSTYLFPAFAQWFTDGFLMTDAHDRRKTFTCHQIDLNSLYGLDREQTTALRMNSEKPGEKGLLKFEMINGEVYAQHLYDAAGNVKEEFQILRKPIRIDDFFTQTHLPPDAIAKLKSSIFAFGGERANSTPYTSALNTLFLREHNRIANELEKENPNWDDERVFQTVRNINLVILIKIVVEEYVNHIAPQYFCFTADPSACWKASWNRPTWMPVEFNLLYRWHSLTPDRFEIAGKTYGGWDILFNNAPLLDTGLAALLEAASKQRAWEIGLFNTPDFLERLQIDKHSIQQGRDNKLASYNDYRVAFDMPRVTAFEQITDDQEKIEALKKLYKNVDDIEFFVGIFAEPIMFLGALPPLMKRIVALDAFSHALLNPLLSEHVFNETTFTKSGMNMIAQTSRLADIVARNSRTGQTAQLTMDWN